VRYHLEARSALKRGRTGTSPRQNCCTTHSLRRTRASTQILKAPRTPSPRLSTSKTWLRSSLRRTDRMSSRYRSSTRISQSSRMVTLSFHQGRSPWAPFLRASSLPRHPKYHRTPKRTRATFRPQTISTYAMLPLSVARRSSVRS